MSWPQCEEFLRAAPLISNSLQQGSFPPVVLFQAENDLSADFCLGVAALFICVDGTACGHCVECRELATQKHPDILILRGADDQSLKVEDLQGFEEFLQYTPQRRHAPHPRRILILDGIEFVTSAVANKLLRPFEEPVSSAQIILTTSRIKQVPATLLSRCVRWRVKSVPKESDGKPEFQNLIRHLVIPSQLGEILKAAEKIQSDYPVSVGRLMDGIERGLNEVYRSAVAGGSESSSLAAQNLHARRELLRRLHRVARGTHLSSQLVAENVGGASLPR